MKMGSLTPAVSLPKAERYGIRVLPAVCRGVHHDKVWISPDGIGLRGKLAASVMAFVEACMDDRFVAVGDGDSV